MKNPATLQIALICLLAVGTLLAVPGSAVASCTGKCELDTSGGGFCLRCVDAGYETGALCSQSGPCGCYFIQCPFSIQTSAETVATVQDAVAAELFKAPEPAAQTPNLEGACTPEQVLFGLPAGR